MQHEQRRDAAGGTPLVSPRSSCWPIGWGGELFEQVGCRLALTETGPFGYYPGPDVLVDEIPSRLQVDRVGAIDEVEEHFLAISIERRITHPCGLTITRAARNDLFQSPPGATHPRSHNGSRGRPRGARP